MNQIYSRFGKLALVNIASNLMIPLASLIDVAFLGHLSEIRHLAGVAIATVLFNYIYWTFGFLRMATTGTTAQARGRGDEQEVQVILWRNCAIALLIGIAILILQQPLGNLGFALLHTDIEILESAQAYYDALIWAAPATLINFVLFGWFLGNEQSKQVLLLSITDKGTNIALDYLFIVKLGWSSAGAGGATAISQYVNLLLGLCLSWQFVPWRKCNYVISQICDFAQLKTVFALNRDILLRTWALVSALALFTNLSSTFGTTILAANTLLLQVISIASYFIDGIAFATESLVGYLHGEANYQQLAKLVKLAGVSSLAIGLSIAGLFCLFPAKLFGVLTNHEQVIVQVESYVLWLLPLLAFGAIAYMLDGYFLGLTAGKTIRNSMILSFLLGFLPLALVAAYLQNSQLLWLALVCFMAARAITLGLNVAKFFTFS